MEHISVLLNETINLLDIKNGGIYVDCTLGGGGHSLKILEILSGSGHLYGIDQDEEAIAFAKKRLEKFNNKTIIHGNFRDAKKLLEEYGIAKVDGILLDLGVSSFQFDDKERGFSYRFDALLDMRMDKNTTLTAKEIVNTYSESDLYRVLRDYGEDSFSKNIAKHIVNYRKNKEIETSFELVDIIKAAIPARVRNNKKGHPAKQTFQALRIEVNDELNILEAVLDDLLSLLKNNGRLAIITFHSLEDRIVKNKFKTWQNPCTCDGLPVCICEKKPYGKALKKVFPSDEEIKNNNRSKSAILRVFEKIGE